MSSFKPVTHVIFDMDGLLLDTERLYTAATQNVADRYGKQYTWEIKVKLMGMTGPVAAQCIIEALDLPLTVPEYLAAVEQEYKQLFPTAVLLPGAEKLVRHLHKKGIPIAIASGGAQESYDLKTTNHREFVSLFHHVVLASSDPEVARGKPDPDVFLVCARRFPDSPAPEKCLVFEDAPNGVKAGAGAGMQVVLVPDPRLQPDLHGPATQVLPSLQHFVPELFGLPPYN